MKRAPRGVSRPASRLRVTYIGHTAMLSGGELALARLIPALADIEPSVILAEDGPLVGRLLSVGVPVEVVPMAPAMRDLRRDRVRPGRLPMSALAGSLTGIWRLACHLRADRPDLVHTNTLKAALYGGVAGRLAGVPVVWHLRDRIADDYLPRPAVRLIQLAGRRLPAAVIGNSEATLSTLGLPTRSRIYHAVVPSPVASVTGKAVAAERPFTVGIVGRLAPWKGQDVFLRAFAQAFPDGETRARIVGSAMFGEDDWLTQLTDLSMELGVAERVEFVGFTEDVQAQYEALDVFVHAAVIPEPFGQVVYEAMACGLPIVAPDAGGPGEAITHGVDGLLYEMGDIEGLANGLRQLAAEPALRARMGAAGRRRVTAFAPEKVAAQVMEVYVNVLSARRRRWRRPGGS